MSLPIPSSDRSPETPIKCGKRNLRATENNSCCLCCGINLHGAGSTFNIQTNKVLRKKIADLVQDELDPDNQSTRVCKVCFRRVESLSKKSADLCGDLTEFRQSFARINIATTFVKRLAKSSPPASSHLPKRRRVCRKLFSSPEEVSQPEPQGKSCSVAKETSDAFIEVSICTLHQIANNTVTVSYSFFLVILYT